jgi:UDP-N-acetylglucosamine 2-epimerase (non-hydrolysing)
MTPPRILTIFGTRPEVIKLAPVIRKLETFGEKLSTVNVTSAQHTDLLYPFTDFFQIRIDHNLKVMVSDQTPNQVCSRVLEAVDSILLKEDPTLVLVQGDTSTAMAGALAAFNRQIPVAHVEAGLRSWDPNSPYPEEMNRRLITRLATYHFAATPTNRDNLLAEGVEHSNIFLTGNPVVESLTETLSRAKCSTELADLLSKTSAFKNLVLTTHRRESFDKTLDGNLEAIRHFVDARPDIALIFPVHPNPSVRQVTTERLSNHPRIHLINPLDYQDFIILLSKAWLIVSDSGGVQEEAPTLGKPLLVLRENTERPEGLDVGVARLVGGRPETLAAMLEEAYQPHSWICKVSAKQNPFGYHDSGEQIATAILSIVNAGKTAALKTQLVTPSGLRTLKVSSRSKIGDLQSV